MIMVRVDDANRNVIPLRTTRSVSSATEVPDRSIAKLDDPCQRACGPKKRLSQHAALFGAVPKSSFVVSAEAPMLSNEGRNAEQSAQCRSKRIGTRDEPSMLAGCE
jgi:hypothetical protein